MIAGFGGDLISHSFVEEELLPQIARDDRLVSFERLFVRWWRRVDAALGPASSARSVHDVAVAPLLQLLGHDRPAVAPHALGYCGPIANSRVSCLSLAWSVPVANSWRAAPIGRGSPAPWTLVSNGRTLRIIDGSRTWARKGIEFDLGAAASSPKTIAVLWQLAQARSLSADDGWSLRSIVDKSDAHAIRVCGSLGNGVLDALPRLASALADGGKARVTPALDQSLTVLYRILFLLFAEARGMVPVWHEVYRDSYSIDVLAHRAMRGRSRGLWPALRAISRLAHAGCEAGDLHVTAFNGRLFSPRHAPLIEQRRVPDTVAADVLLALASEKTASGRRRISYHDLGVEQLGSVYERVLEYEPVTDGRAILLSRTSKERKSTGSFYTPRSITEYLVRRTLSPLVDGKSAEEILQLRVVDPAMGSGAFLVAACRYLSAQCEQACIRDGQWSASEIPDQYRAALRRRVAEECLFGVDLNSTAVQLARLSLWLTTMAAERPLTFLDHHLVAGNSLLGARLADLSRPVRTTPQQRERTLPLFDDQLSDTVARQILPARLRIAGTPSDSIEIVRTKERLLADLAAPNSASARWSAAADAWCAAVLSPAPRPSAGVVAEWIAAAIGAPTTLPAASLDRALRHARQVAATHGALHWELVFPEVFFDSSGRLRPDGGFDAVIGNPPWDMMRADMGSASDRALARSTTGAALRFYRDSGTYRLQGNGHGNRYQLFLERALQLARPQGRVGVILPSGIGTDHGSAVLRRHLFDRTSIDSWLGFDNRRRIFPIHRSMRFVILTTTNTASTPALNFRCGLIDARALDRDEPLTPLTVSRGRLETWSADLAIPELPDAAALEIFSGVAARLPALSNPDGWNVRFGRELNATDDRPHFVTLGPSRQRVLPIVEGKLIAPFQVDLTRATSGVPPTAAARLIDPASFQRTRIAYRDVAGATNKLTLIAALLPPGVISTHTVFVSKSAIDERSLWCLLGLLNSFVANFLVRAQVMTHVTASLMARLPVPRPPDRSPAFEEIVSLSRTLSREGPAGAGAKYARLNALAGLAYGLRFDQFKYVTDTFPLIDAAVRSRALEEFALLDRAVLPRLQ